jgi:hypothetical protein
MKKLLYRVARNGGVVFAEPDRAKLIAKIHAAIGSSTTWGEFRFAMPREEYEDLIKTAFDDNGEPRPRSTEPFSGETLDDLRIAACETGLLSHLATREGWGDLFFYGLDEVASAICRGIDVTKLETLAELRKAEADLRRARRKAKSAARQSSGLLRGVLKAAQEHCSVELEPASAANSALIQRLGAVYANLPSEHRALFESQLKRLVGLYRPLAPGS